MEINTVFSEIKAASEYANKELGQNYLIDAKISEKIVNLLSVNESDNVLEIGAGFGSLSIFLLNTKYKTLTLNDVDPRAISYLDEMVKDAKRAYVLNKSALKIDIKHYSKVIGNLPYYITNDLLETYFAKCNADKYVLMVQKEVEDRLIAKPNNENYGPLAILVDYIGDYKKEFIVNKTSFLPSPHIDSLVFSLTRKHKDIDQYQYLQFLKKMFIHRRKTIYNNLSLYLMNKDKAKNILDKLKISILIRPEQIEPKVYLNIFNLTK